MWVSICIVLIVLLLLWPWLLEFRRSPMDARARARAPGGFVDLSKGKTHYRWDGPETGPVVVAIHGLTTPNFIWNAIVPRFTARGIRVLRYDLYGRGFSDRPHGPQDRAFFLGQLNELLDALDLTEPVGVMGYSMGGAIATAFAAEHPNRTRNVILVAPAGLGFEATPFEAFVARMPILGDWVMGLLYERRTRRALKDDEDGEVPGITKAKARELNYKGHIRSVLASLRGILLERMLEDHEKIAALKIPVLSIWAENDDVIPLRGLGHLTQINRASRNDMISGAGHILPHTHAAEIMASLGALSRP
ncbi:MAG: alpha/beta fold hydrolase [Pseudomonadota bacterium]